jgi:hypothetical protein
MIRDSHRQLEKEAGLEAGLKDVLIRSAVTMPLVASATHGLASSQISAANRLHASNEAYSKNMAEDMKVLRDIAHVRKNLPSGAQAMLRGDDKAHLRNLMNEMRWGQSAQKRWNRQGISWSDAPSEASTFIPKKPATSWRHIMSKVNEDVAKESFKLGTPTGFVGGLLHTLAAAKSSPSAVDFWDLRR